MLLFDMSTTGISTATVGLILAIVLSWSRNQSILWAIVHAFFGWIYVVYYVFTR